MPPTDRTNRHPSKSRPSRIVEPRPPSLVNRSHRVRKLSNSVKHYSSYIDFTLITLPLFKIKQPVLRTSSAGRVWEWKKCQMCRLQLAGISRRVDRSPISQRGKLDTSFLRLYVIARTFWLPGQRRQSACRGPTSLPISPHSRLLAAAKRGSLDQHAKSFRGCRIVICGWIAVKFEMPEFYTHLQFSQS